MTPSSDNNDDVEEGASSSPGSGSPLRDNGPRRGSSGSDSGGSLGNFGRTPPPSVS